MHGQSQGRLTSASDNLAHRSPIGNYSETDQIGIIFVSRREARWWRVVLKGG